MCQGGDLTSPLHLHPCHFSSVEKGYFLNSKIRGFFKTKFDAKILRLIFFFAKIEKDANLKK
jgi:hypothetical protein